MALSKLAEWHVEVPPSFSTGPSVEDLRMTKTHTCTFLVFIKFYEHLTSQSFLCLTMNQFNKAIGQNTKKHNPVIFIF